MLVVEDIVSFNHKGLTGSEIGNYKICKRKAWLFHHRLGMEYTSELVKMGHILHELEDSRKKEVKIDDVVIDRITDKYVVEVKKTDAHPESARWQLLYYLYLLKQKGVIKKGMIEYKSAKGNKREYVELNEDNEVELLRLIDEIENYFDEEYPKKYKKIPECASCAYFNYCNI